MHILDGQFTPLQHLHADFGQSPWLDNLTRGSIRDGTLARMVDEGIRGVTANPTILAKAIGGSADYDEQFASLIAAGRSVEDAYWQLGSDDVAAALAIMRPLYDASDGDDGFVSLEVAPELADDTPATIAAARGLHELIAAPNLFVKIPATTAGIPAIEAMVAEGRNVNITLIFSLTRYQQVVEAYLSGLETFVSAGGDPSAVRSVASFFVSRVDSEVDQRLDGAGDPDATALQGRAAVAQARLAYQLFTQRFAGPRWERLAARGARVQRPLWASTSTKNPTYPDTMYVDSLIGPDTVTTLPEPTIAAFTDHGTAARTIDTDLDSAAQTMRRLAAAGVDMEDVGVTLEQQGIAAFRASFQEVLATLQTKAELLTVR